MSYGCAMDGTSGCKTCVASRLRTSDRDCASCNDGFFLSGANCVEEPPTGIVLQGQYECAQGSTGLQVHIDAWPEARFKFYPVSSSKHQCSGEFHMSGSSNGTGLTFTPKSSDAWISNPCTYSTVGLNGIVTGSGQYYSGSIPSTGCSMFNVSLQMNSTEAVLVANRFMTKSTDPNASRPCDGCHLEGGDSRLGPCDGCHLEGGATDKEL